jgi:hypothetical protein
MSANQKLAPRADLWAAPRALAGTRSMKSTEAGVVLGTLPHASLSATPPESQPVSDPLVRTWRAAAAIAQGTTLSSATPSVAVDSRGHAFAVWVHADGGTESIWFNRYVPGMGWGAAEQVRTRLRGRASNPQVAIDEQGDALVVWSQVDGARRTVWASRLVAGLAWGAPSRLTADPFTDADSPRIATDARGGAVVVWRQFDDRVSRNVWASRYVPGEGWSPARCVGREGAGTAFDPQVAVDEYGHAFVLWIIPGSQRGTVWCNRYVVGRGWQEACALNAGHPGDVVDPRLVCGADGHAMAVWCQRLGAHYGVWASRHAPLSGWGEAERVGVDLSTSASSPQIALNARGDAIAVWDQSDGLGSSVWANRCVAARGWGMASPILIDSLGDAGSPQVVLDDMGNAMAMWIQSMGSHFGVQASRYSRGRGWDRPAYVQSGNAESLGTPQIAMDASGNAVAAWLQVDPAGFSIRASVYR